MLSAMQISPEAVSPNALAPDLAEVVEHLDLALHHDDAAAVVGGDTSWELEDVPLII